ncbi:MAG TPA: MBL fold metallo-hydrolase [Candidatus Limnocylindrales bacterium]
MTGSSPWAEIADGVLVRRYAFLDQTIGLVLGDGEALVIDTRSSPRLADELLGEIRAVTAAPLVVVDTHHHWDHTFGNGRFRPAPIWGHRRCAEVLRESGGAMRARVAAGIPELVGELDDLVIDPPDRTFDETARLLVGGRRVELAHLGRGHTDNDIVIQVPDAGLVFAGDLVEVGAPPSFGDSFPLDWPETLARLLDLPFGTVVPGHGDVTDRSFVEAQLADIAAVAEAARRARIDGGSVDEALELVTCFPPEVAREALDRAFGQLEGRW